MYEVCKFEQFGTSAQEWTIFVQNIFYQGKNFTKNIRHYSPFCLTKREIWLFLVLACMYERRDSLIPICDEKCLVLHKSNWELKCAFQYKFLIKAPLLNWDAQMMLNVICSSFVADISVWKQGHGPAYGCLLMSGYVQCKVAHLMCHHLWLQQCSGPWFA